MNPDQLTPTGAGAPDRDGRPEADPVAQDWQKRLAAAKRHWEKLHKRIKHNRKTVAGFDWKKDPTSKEFVDLRANLIFSTAQATLPNIYARNPDVSVTGAWRNGNVRLFCETLETVLSRQMQRANLKKRMKLAVLGALTEYFGVVKITYQRDRRSDPIIAQRINDTQDNLDRLDAQLAALEDPENAGHIDLHRRELENTMRGLEAKSEVVVAEGLVIDRVMPEHLLIDPSVVEFDDYENAGWQAQAIPMSRKNAKAQFKMELKGARAYKAAGPDGDGLDAGAGASSRLGMPGEASSTGGDDEQVLIWEIWDRASQLVYTIAEGCDYFCREAYGPEKVGQRWYPFFILPYAVLPGQFVAPCLVDLTEKLQNEYNDTRDKFAQHRELNKPGWVADSGSVDAKSLKRHTDSVLGEITLLDAQGKPIQQVIQPKQAIPVNPGDYDTSPIRQDWEQVTGLQDAARSTVVQPKTATEASIMQQSLSGRTSEFRDKLEDQLQEMDLYAAQILLQELTPAQVERYTGPHKVAPVPTADGGTVMQVVEPAYDWPQLSQDQVFDMVEISIVAGSSGAPDKEQSQRIWTQAFPVIQGLITQIMQINAQRLDYSPLEALLRETLKRFDDRIDVDQFLPKPLEPLPPPALPGVTGPVPGATPGQPLPAAAPANDPMAAVQQGGAIPGAPGQAPAIPAVNQ